MSFKNKFFSFLTVALGVVVFSTFAMAQDAKPTTSTTTDKTDRVKGVRGEGGRHKFGHEGRGGKHGGGMMRMFHDLNLTDAQKQQIHTIMESNKPDEATMTEFRSIREAKRAGTEPTAEQKDRMKAFHEQSRAKAKSTHEQILSVLTAEQRAQLDQKKAEMKQKMQERKQQRELRRQNRTTTTTDKPKDN